MDEWIEKGYPKSLHERAYELGIQVVMGAMEGAPPLPSCCVCT